MNLWMDAKEKKLCEEKLHLLCFWKAFDENYLLAHALAKLSNNFRVVSENGPSTTTTGTCDKNSIILSDKKAQQIFNEIFPSHFTS